MSAEKIINIRDEKLTSIKSNKLEKQISPVRVDINNLLARVRKKQTEENKVNLVFFALFAALVLIVGILLSF